jgi:hypothetical protein
LASLKPADVVNILTVTFKIMSEEILSPPFVIKTLQLTTANVNNEG